MPCSPYRSAAALTAIEKSGTPVLDTYTELPLTLLPEATTREAGKTRLEDIDDWPDTGADLKAEKEWQMELDREKPETAFSEEENQTAAAIRSSTI